MIPFDALISVSIMLDVFPMAVISAALLTVNVAPSRRMNHEFAFQTIFLKFNNVLSYYYIK